MKTVDALQKALDEELAERTLELRATDRAKSDFMRLVAHELRAPMAIASGYVSMIRDGSFGPVPAPIREALPIVEVKLQEMGRLVAQMLEVARVEDGQILLKREPLDLTSVLQQAVKAATSPARPPHEIKVSVPDHEVRVHGDRSRLLTILSNLISNAIKYSPRGGVVEISARVERNRASVTVRDQGIGISERDLPRLFSRFGRVESEQTQAISGTGLGLYLSRELARRHRGDITVESVEGSGSAFTLTIPYAPMAGRAG